MPALRFARTTPRLTRASGLRQCSWLTRLIAGAGIGGMAVLGLGYMFYSARAALIDLDIVREMPTASLLYDDRGQSFSRFFDEDRIAMPAGRPVPKLLAEAVVATEDRRFYEHGAIDPIGIARAALSNLLGRERQGGSTITQQLARNSIGRLERTYDRKLLEIFLAHRIEQAYTKEQILRYYLDRIYFGQGLYGAETTANAFFGVSVAQLNLQECALLAGMISSPNSASPWKNVRLAKAARDRALARLEKANFITAAEAARAGRAPLLLRPRPDFSGGFATSEVRKQLTQLLDPLLVQHGGLKIFTTIDAHLQRVAESALATRIAEIERVKGDAPAEDLTTGKQNEDLLQGAFFAQDPATGAIRAIVGSRDFGLSPFNRATQAQRQIGSTLKPLIYAIAFAERGYGPASLLDATHFNLSATTRAQQRSTGPRLVLRVNDALVRSDNYAAVRMGEIVGPDLLNAYAKNCGVTSPIPPYPSSYLGACSMSLSELTGIYATLANGGVYSHPYLIVQIRNNRDEVLYTNTAQTHRVFTPQVARQVTGMLQNVLDFGTGLPVRQDYRFTAPAAGKTGTTNDYKDAWFEGYTSNLVAGVWIGYDQPREVMPGGFAARVALPVWANVMKQVQGRFPMLDFPVPPGLQVVTYGGNLFGARGERYFLTPAQQERSPGEPSDAPREAGRSLISRIFDLFR